MAGVARSESVWDDLPQYRKVQKWVEVIPDGAERIMAELEKEAEWARRDAERRLTCAMVLTIAATVTLALLDKTLPAIFSSSGGTIGVATTLITGRSPALRRKR